MAAGFFGVLGSQLMLSGTGQSAHAATGPELAGDGFSVRADNATVYLVDSAGTSVQKFRGYRLGSLNLTTGSAVIGAAEDGTPAIVVTYDVATAGSSVTGYFIPRGRSLEVTFDIVSPGTASASSGMMRREAITGQVVETYSGVAEWERDERGGIPYQTDQKTVFEQEFDENTLYLVAPGSNSGWRDGWSIHLPATTISDGVFRATAGLALAKSDRPKLIEALVSNVPLAVDIWTDRPYSIFESADAPLTVHGAAFNGGSARTATFTWTAHDWNGTVVGSRTQAIAAAEQQKVADNLSFSLPGRGIAFVELTVTAGADTAYTRTNVAVLPPHDFVDTSATSFIGIAADYLFGPAEERALLKRIGVRHSRHTHFSTEELSTYDFTQHRLRTPASPEEFDGDPAALTAYVESELDIAESKNATHYECANEWNMRGGVLQGVGAEKYVTKWATAFRDGIDARGSDMKLIAVGLAGMDNVYAQKMFDAGLANKAHAFNLHPGRGNFTPDYAPTPDEWTNGSNGSYWNYLGALNEARRMIDEYSDDMEFWLTEAYTPTKPNSWWDDSYRHAGENVLLTVALAASANVTVMEWYQFYDNVKANPYGASETNREYHFGLVLRDQSPKPSLLALANASEHLDQATFTRWFDFSSSEHDSLRGLLFDTPRGPLSILWSRTDGYLLNTEGTRDGGFFPEPEPWVDSWPTKTTVSLPATGKTVTQIDAIGQRVEISVVGGCAEITLDGAPRIFYGLDVDGADAATPASSGPATVKPQRVNDKVSVAVHVRNETGAKADIAIATPFGEKKFSNVANDKAVYQLFETDAESIPVGRVTVKVKAKGKTDKKDKGTKGSPKKHSYSVDYSAFSILPFA